MADEPLHRMHWLPKAVMIGFWIVAGVALVILPFAALYPELFE